VGSIAPNAIALFNCLVEIPLESRVNVSGVNHPLLNLAFIRTAERIFLFLIGFCPSAGPLCHLNPRVSYKRVCKDNINLRGRKLGVRLSYESVLFDDSFLKFYTRFADNVSQQKCAMSIEGQMRVAYYLRVSTESQELDNQRTEILPFVDRRGWKLVHTFEDVMSGQKGEKRSSWLWSDAQSSSSKEVRHFSLLGFGPADQGRYKSDA
jgi:hypothetical protein